MQPAQRNLKRRCSSTAVRTILNYDIFGKGYMKYCVHNHCEEVPEVDYEDGLTFLYFNTGEPVEEMKRSVHCLPICRTAGRRMW